MSKTGLSQAVVSWLAAHEAEMVALLGELVNVDSGTYNKAGVDAAGEVLQHFWRAQGLSVSVIPHETFGDALIADLPCPEAKDQRPVLMMGHRDTVFPDGEAGRRPFTVRDGRGYGPGVADMKSGLVIEAFVMAAFAACGAPGAPLRMLTTSDEEIASPACAPDITAQAKLCRAVFNAEPSRRNANAPAGNQNTQVVTRGRKGGVFMRVETVGKAAHSGAHYERGRSAILDLAQKVAPLHALTDLQRGITVNVGLIGGGQTVNTIAPSAWMEIDLRYIEPPQREEAVSAIRKIVETPAVEGVTAELIIKGEFLPLVQTPESVRLLEAYTRAAAGYGITVTADFTGGCADSGLTAAAGCPTLCSVGPVGGGGHTPEEFIEMASLVPAAQTLALAICDSI
ncbi:MAG: peptidase M20 [Rhizobiales bacterium PAR1]|nr:MAG: peptidase M20 [Rhizobiales bacterium PAR1]